MRTIPQRAACEAAFAAPAVGRCRCPAGGWRDTPPTALLLVLPRARPVRVVVLVANRRQRRVGLLSLGAGLGLFFGSLVSGPIVDRWGYATQFGLLGAVYLVIPCLGLCLFAAHAALRPR